MKADPKLAARVLIYTNRKWTAKQISEVLGISERHVTRIRSRYRTPGKTGRPTEWGEEELKTAKELLDDQASYRDVAETTGISKDALRRHFPGQGFTTEDTARLATTLPKLPESLRWSLTRNRKD